MGACFSSKTELTSKAIRVVRLDGSLEDYDGPATVNQVINNFPKHFLCNPIQILQDGLVPLRLEQLKMGQIYFMLPVYTLKFNASPMDLTSLTRKLTNIAKTGRCPAKPSDPINPSASPLRGPKDRSLNRFDRRCGGRVENMGNTGETPRWKPILAPIGETSFR
ncbi:hypothetical protein R6Q57_028282 [Mikania cordata]